MLCLAFFFLLRPGEYTVKTDNTPFRLKDAALLIGARRIDPQTATPADFLAVSAVCLTFTTQKNGVRGERITHGKSGDPLACPCAALARRVSHLVEHKLPPTTPLGTFVTETGRTSTVSSKNVYDALKIALLTYGTERLDITPEDIQARSLRAGGATALLNAGIDSDVISLLGRWRSDAMLRYLHVSASTAVQHYAKEMFQGGTFTFRPNSLVPPDGLVPQF